MRPKTLNDIVGQEDTKTVLRTLIEFSKNKSKAIPHILLSGPAGIGKTSIAQAVAAENSANLFQANCAMIGKSQNLFKIIDEMAEKDILFLDENHALSKKSSESLYTILEDFCYYEEGYKVTVPEITIIGASTEIGRLPLPMKSRFKFTATLMPYNDTELSEVCKAIFQNNGMPINDDMAKVIAKTCRGIPRNMVSRAEWIYAFLSGNSVSGPIDKKKILDIIALQGVNEDGLENHDIQYLKILYEARTGLSLDSIASKISMDKENVLKLVEPHLVKLNFIEKTKGKGRSLTVRGKVYVEKIMNKGKK